MKYSYRCPACGVFTVEQSMKDEPIQQCPDCGEQVKRIIGKNINVIYRTTGFYSTDKSSIASCSEKNEAGACESCVHHAAHRNA